MPGVCPACVSSLCMIQSRLRLAQDTRPRCDLTQSLELVNGDDAPQLSRRGKLVILPWEVCYLNALNWLAVHYVLKKMVFYH